MQKIPEVKLQFGPKYGREKTAGRDFTMVLTFKRL